MWTDQTEQAVIQSIRRALASSVRARRRQAAELLRIYEGDWEDILAAEIREVFASPDNAERALRYEDRSRNLLRWAAERIGAIYDRPPVRLLDGSPSPAYDALTKQAHLDLAMQQVSHYLIVVSEVFVRPAVRVDRAGTPRLYFDLLTPDVVEVRVAQDDPTIVTALAYEEWTEDDSGTPRKRYVYWDADRVLVYDHDWRRVTDPDNPDGLNPYGLIPWVACHRTYPTRMFWHTARSEELRNATLRTALALTDLNHALAEAGYRQIVLSGRPGEDFPARQVRDVGQPLLVGPTGTATTLDTVAPFGDLIDAILSKAGTALNLMGLRPSALRGTVDASSGYALRIQEHGLEEARDRLRTVMSVWEQELYATTARVWNTHTLQRQHLSEDATLTIRWADVGPSAQPKELSEMWGQRVRDGLATREQALQALYGIGEDEARALAADITTEQAVASPIPVAPPSTEAIQQALRTEK